MSPNPARLSSSQAVAGKPLTCVSSPRVRGASHIAIRGWHASTRSHHHASHPEGQSGYSHPRRVVTRHREPVSERTRLGSGRALGLYLVWASPFRERMIRRTPSAIEILGAVFRPLRSLLSNARVEFRQEPLRRFADVFQVHRSLVALAFHEQDNTGARPKSWESHPQTRRAIRCLM